MLIFVIFCTHYINNSIIMKTNTETELVVADYLEGNLEQFFLKIK